MYQRMFKCREMDGPILATATDEVRAVKGHWDTVPLTDQAVTLDAELNFAEEVSAL